MWVYYLNVLAFRGLTKTASNASSFSLNPDNLNETMQQDLSAVAAAAAYLLRDGLEDVLCVT
jgi:hypothetical protein